MAVEIVADGREFPTTHVEGVFARNQIVFEPREITQSDDVTVKYHTWLRSADVARGPERAADGRRHGGVEGGVVGAPETRMTMTVRAPCRRIGIVTAVERAPASAVLDVIRGARSRITLSLFRCNDKAVFARARRAPSIAAWTSRCWSPRAPRAARRSCGSSGARSKQTGAARARLHRSGREVPRQVSGRRRRAGAGRVAELHAEVLSTRRATRWSSPTIRRWSTASAS